jgi:hypothetical protein
VTTSARPRGDNGTCRLAAAQPPSRNGLKDRERPIADPGR